MKKYFVLLTSVVSISAILISCTKEKVESPDDFTVTAEKSTYKVNDTITFTMSTRPEQVIFWSGETGKNYDYRNRTLSSDGITKLFFLSSEQQGVVQPLVSTDSLRLLISNNLSGYDSASVVKATWTDITSRNTKWPTNSLSTAYTNSDSIDLSDFKTADKINIAFRFLGKKNLTVTQRRWYINNLTLTSYFPDGTVMPLLSTFANTGWVQVSLKDITKAWDVGTANISAKDSIRNSSGYTIRSAYPIQYNPGAVVGAEDNDDWLITSAVNLKTIKPDQGTNIARTSNIFKFVGFKKPGTYNVVFVGSNLDFGVNKSKVSMVTITVIP